MGDLSHYPFRRDPHSLVISDQPIPALTFESIFPSDFATGADRSELFDSPPSRARELDDDDDEDDTPKTVDDGALTPSTDQEESSSEQDTLCTVPDHSPSLSPAQKALGTPKYLEPANAIPGFWHGDAAHTKPGGHHYSKVFERRTSIAASTTTMSSSTHDVPSSKGRRDSQATVSSDIIAARFPPSLLQFDSAQRILCPQASSSPKKRCDGTDSGDFQVHLPNEYVLDGGGTIGRVMKSKTKVGSTNFTGPGFASLPSNIAVSPTCKIMAELAGRSASAISSEDKVARQPGPLAPSHAGRARHKSSPTIPTGSLGCPSTLSPSDVCAKSLPSSSVSFTFFLPAIPEFMMVNMRPEAQSLKRAGTRKGHMDLIDDSFSVRSVGGSSSGEEAQFRESATPARSFVSSLSSIPGLDVDNMRASLRRKSQVANISSPMEARCDLEETGCDGEASVSARVKFTKKALRKLGLSKVENDPTINTGRTSRSGTGTTRLTNADKRFEDDFYQGVYVPKTPKMGNLNCCGERQDKAAQTLARDAAMSFLSGQTTGVESDLDKFDRAYAKDDIESLVALIPSNEPFEQSGAGESLHPWASSPRSVGALASTQLAALASTENEEIKDRIRGAGAIPLLIAELSSKKADRADAALVALSFLSIDFPKACVAMFDNNIFPALISLLLKEKIGVVAAAAQTCRNIYVLEVRYRRAFREAGGCQPLVNLLEISSDTMQQSASFDLQFEALFHIDDFIMFNGEEVSDCVAAIKVCNAAQKLGVLQNLEGAGDDLKETARQLYLRLAE